MSAIDSKDLSVDYDRLALADSSANRSIDSKDLSANHSNDSVQNIHKHIILAQNDSATDSTNPNATDSSATNSSDSSANATDSSANATNPSANQSADLGNSNADSTESTEPSLLDKVLGIGDTMRGKSDSYDLGRIERVVGGSADENSTVVVVSSETMEQEGAKDVAHALRFTPGVFYMPYSTGKSSVFIRGFGEEATGFYFDGIPINDIYEGNAAGATDLTPFFHIWLKRDSSIQRLYFADF